MDCCRRIGRLVVLSHVTCNVLKWIPVFTPPDDRHAQRLLFGPAARCSRQAKLSQGNSHDRYDLRSLIMLPTDPDLGEGAVELRDGARDRKRNGMREEERGGKASTLPRSRESVPCLLSFRRLLAWKNNKVEDSYVIIATGLA